MKLRIGKGFDVHRLVVNKPCILGGVHIPFEKGLEGHSDADVLAHAVSDALLGAAGLGDIGRHFPDTDEQFKGADSMKLLAEVYALIKIKGWKIENIDATIMAERPKISPYATEMQGNFARILEINLDQINIKGTTTEKLGFVGREEGIAAEAIVLLSS